MIATVGAVSGDARSGGGSLPSAIRVLVVDDDEQVRTLLIDLLVDEGFTADEADSAEAALGCLDRGHPDVVLLDVAMPVMSGLDLLAEIRRRAEVPVIFVTARGTETDRVLGLRLGADDYVVKPFSSAELVARIHSVLRRARTASAPPADDKLVYGALSVDPTSREVHVDGVEVVTTAKEFDLLAFLARSPRQVFTREQLLDQVWGSSTEWQDPATVTEHIRRIRRKIEPDPDAPRWLRTVRGVGYRFEG
jgi:two-component system, OmpR family, phosphate regulon response regulator PhoB